MIEYNSDVKANCQMAGGHCDCSTLWGCHYDIPDKLMLEEEMEQTTMTPNEYQKLAARTVCNQSAARDRIGYPNKNNKKMIELLHAVIGMSMNVGELSRAIEEWIWHGQLFDKKNMCEELGDLLWYIAEACTALGDVSLEMIMIANIQKLKVRYPEKYSDSNQGWAEPSEDKLETLSQELRDKFEHIYPDPKYGFDVARQIVDTYLTERDSRIALEFIKGSERRCRAES